MSLSFWQIAVVALLVIVLFGRGKISSLMKEMAEGIKSFRKGLEVKDAEIIEVDEKENTNKKQDK